MNEISFPYKNSIMSIDFCLLLNLVGFKLGNKEIIGLDCSNLSKISFENAIERIKKMGIPDVYVTEYNEFCIYQYSPIYIVISCILEADEIFKFSNFDFKDSNEHLLLYVKKFNGARLYLSVYQDSDQNIVKYQLDCDCKYSSYFLMNYIKQYDVSYADLEEKISGLSNNSQNLRELIDVGINNFISMQILLPDINGNSKEHQHTVNGLLYIISFADSTSGVFAYDTKNNQFSSEALIAENTDLVEILSKWLKKRFEK